ncbi:MAG TPA: hypothetical protein DCP37_16005, partial [Dehalococcoidia bacterium]|nr:hypothetical protein [Dehalococcoidia bacterium]
AGAIGFWMAMIAASMTGFYIFRALFMTFEGEFKGGSDADPADALHGPVHLAESPTSMVLPLVILGVASLVIGFLVNPIIDLGIVPKHWFLHFLGEGPVRVEIHDFNVILAVGAMLTGVSGIVLAYFMYIKGTISPARVSEAVKPVHTLLLRKYYFDKLYEDWFVRRFFYGGLAKWLDWADKTIIDNIVNKIGALGRNIGVVGRELQNGQLQEYGAAIFVGVLTIVGLYIWFL